jgi:hypothetical protein
MMSWQQYGEDSMRRKRHAPIPLEGGDEPCSPPPEEYLYRCSVCSEEMLVNEAIIDVAISAATFRGEYEHDARRLLSTLPFRETSVIALNINSLSMADWTA